jgi:hypothetical protein
VPTVFDALQVGDLTKLYLAPELAKTIEKHLDQYRLLTTNLRIREPRYVGVKVTTEIVVSEYSQPQIVVSRVADSLKGFISPLKLEGTTGVASDIMGPEWEGWPFGRSLFVSEIYSLLQKIPGVKHVLDVQLSSRAVIPAKEKALGSSEETEETTATPAPEDAEMILKKLDGRKLDIPNDALLCSLEHEIKITDL